MKKLLTLITILAMAVTMQAASMTWIVTNIKTPADSSVAAPDGWLAYLFSTGDTSASAVSTALAKKDLSILSSAFDTTTTAGGKVSKAEVGSFKAGDTFEGFAVILDASSSANAKNFIVTRSQSKTVNDLGGNISLSLGSQANATWSQISSVPEPATGALALAGIALLFRRRKA